MIATARTIAVAAFIALGTALPAFAQPAMQNGSMAEPARNVKLVHVNRCDPQLNQQVVAPAYVGFGPGFYPAGPYFWGDAYGYNYRQPVLSSTNGTLYLDYINVTHQVMSTIEFGLIANGRLVAEVRDVGKFSPNAEIKHSFGLSPNVFPIQTGLPQCVPLRITYADGTKWRNPHLPALQHQIYGNTGQ